MKYLLAVVMITLFASCDYFKKEAAKEPIARVNDTYLFEEDVAAIFGNLPNDDDSLQWVNNFINKWATQQLLIDQAKINLPEAKLKEFESLINQYRIDLYTEAYKSNIVSKQLDSLITKAELVTYYEQNKENFTLNDELLKLRYIFLKKDFSNLSKVKSLLMKFEREDVEALSNMSIQFTSYNFNDSTWIKKDNLYQVMPVLQNRESSEVLKKGYFGQIEDSLGVYLIKIEDILKRNDIAPLSYVEPTIRQIILNKRKQQLIKILEKDITKDAIKNKSFEIYTKE